jgi:hypothetical protein
MSGDATDRRFVCPECHGWVPVDSETRRAIVTHGCVLCGTAVTPDAFSV